MGPSLPSPRPLPPFSRPQPTGGASFTPRGGKQVVRQAKKIYDLSDRMRARKGGASKGQLRSFDSLAGRMPKLIARATLKPKPAPKGGPLTTGV